MHPTVWLPPTSLPAAHLPPPLSLLLHPPSSPTGREQLAPALARLAGALCRVDTFYDSMGGLVGYQLKSLELILSAEAAAAGAAAAAAPSHHNSSSSSAQQQGPAAGDEAAQAQAAEGSPSACYHVPPGLDLAGEAGRQLGQRAAAEGLLAMPYLAEILPVGGAGDRLGLTCDVTGQPLPSAMLPYLGRPILEGLLRDLQAREYLYWHLTGTQVGGGLDRVHKQLGTGPCALRLVCGIYTHRTAGVINCGLLWAPVSHVVQASPAQCHVQHLCPAEALPQTKYLLVVTYSTLHALLPCSTPLTHPPITRSPGDHPRGHHDQ